MLTSVSVEKITGIQLFYEKGTACPPMYFIAGGLVNTGEDPGSKSEQVLQQVSPPQLV